MSNREEFEKQMKGTFGMLVDLRAREGTGFSYMDWGTQVAWVMWQARVPEGYVVVPKEPSSEIIVAIESKVEDQLKASAIEADPFRLDGETIYEAMIEAVEK